MHVDAIGAHVAEGHYDLIGPNGEIILPQVWETMIEPDWSITMQLWPIPEPKGPPGMPGGHHHFHPGDRPPRSSHRARGPPPGPPPSGHRGGGPPPPPPANWPGPGAPSRGPPPGPGPAGPPPIIVVGPGGPSRSGGKRAEKSSKSMLGWMAGKPVKSSGKGSCLLYLTISCANY